CPVVCVEQDLLVGGYAGHEVRQAVAVHVHGTHIATGDRVQCDLFTERTIPIAAGPHHTPGTGAYDIGMPVPVHVGQCHVARLHGVQGRYLRSEGAVAQVEQSHDVTATGHRSNHVQVTIA